jgi:hypothetical protein
VRAAKLAAAAFAAAGEGMIGLLGRLPLPEIGWSTRAHGLNCSLRAASSGATE